MGAWFPKDRGGMFNLEPLGKTHQNCQLPISCLSPILYFCQKLVEVVIAWEWEEYGKNSNWEGHPFWKNVFWHRWQVKTHASMFFSSSRFWSSWAFSIHIFGSVLHFSHGWEVVLLMYSGWDLFLAFLCCFHILTVGDFVFSVLHNQWGIDPRI